MLRSKEADHELPGFEAPTKEASVNDGQSSKKKGSGGFQSMGFSFPVLKGIIKRGYKQPTPIQRKVRLSKVKLYNLKKSCKDINHYYI